ncbi:MAG: asparagine synthase (glutamine-hydrolyzing) [Myxococcota bacterium]|jgi:asparagine synthase (glutamine-hydrolysing)
MCGIFAMLETAGRPDARQIALSGARTLRHRGPDWSGVYADDNAVLAHERLAIVDMQTGAQPLREVGGSAVLAVNGEIYNHASLREDFPNASFATHSDCEIIIPLWRDRGADLVHALRGMFAFVIYDSDTGDWMMARDPIGVIPLYTGRDDHGTLYVASEMKALMSCCSHVQEFLPGHVWSSGDAEPVRWYQRDWQSYDNVTTEHVDPSVVREALIDSVRSHLMSDVPYGVLLSGGLDSSVVAAIAAKLVSKRIEDNSESDAWWPRLHTFSIGLEDSPDLVAAQKVADFLGTVHHPFVYTFEEGLDAIRDVIHHIETYDVTSIRASTPMYLMARRIKAMGVKMVLSGEGADEIFGGYLYFHKAPSAEAFHEETVDKLAGLHMYDCLRANKSMLSWGVEARVPFLDTTFLDVAMNVPASQKMSGPGKIEKHVLRHAFDGWLPDEVLWRQKEQFSDGVGYGWVDGLKAHAASKVTEQMMAQAAMRFPIGTPTSKEGYFYRQIFEELFPLPSAAACVPSGPTIACSTSRAVEWDASFKNMADPSGRAVMGVHDAAYDGSID